MPESVRIVLVGCGGVGLRHLAAYEALARNGVPTVELVGVCDNDSKRLATAVDGHLTRTGRPLRAFSSLDDIDGATAVDLAVPTLLHHVLGERACEMGMHVLVEKPIALTLLAAQKLADAAARANVILAVAENFRRVAANRALRQVIHSGIIGRPQWMTAHLLLPDRLAHPLGGADWYRDGLASGSLAALEMGVHDADLISYWFGPVARVTGRVQTLAPQVTGTDGRLIDVTSDDTCFATLETSGGVIVQMTLTMAGHGAPHGARLLAGSEGNVTSTIWEGWQGGRISTDAGYDVPYEWYVSQYVAGLADDQREAVLPRGTFVAGDWRIDAADPLRYGMAAEIADFAAAVLGNRAPEVSAVEGMTALATALAIAESSHSGGTVEVADVVSGRIRGWQEPTDLHLGLRPASRS